MTDRVRLEAEGALLERLVDKALAEGVRFTQIRRIDRRRLWLETDSSGARSVLALLEAYHLSGRVVGVSGWPRLMKRLRARWTLLAGILICAGLLAAFSSFVWRLEITELSGEPVAREVYRALEEWGVCLPLDRRKVDAALLRLRLMSRFPQYGYVGVRESGATLRIELARAHDAPPVYELDAGRDLVAAQDGVVLRVTVLSGTAAVQPGDTVRKGQLLIRGEERVSREETRGICALGEVIARVWYEGACTLPLREREVFRTGRESRESALSLLSWRHTLLEGEAFDRCEQTTRDVPLGGVFLPLKLVETTRYEIRERQRELPLEEIRRQAAELAALQARAQIGPGEEACGAWTDYTMEESALTARAVVEVRAQIAATRPSSQE